MSDDPLRLFLVLRRGAVETLEEAAVLGGAAAVACVRGFDIPDEWRERPGKVCLRARNASQWAEVLELPHALAGDPDGASVDDIILAAGNCPVSAIFVVGEEGDLYP